MALHRALIRYPLCFALLWVIGCDGGQPTEKVVYPAMQSNAFRVYSSQCSQCHAPPLPSVHRANEWPAVIARMQQHRIQRAYGPIPAPDTVIIREYLTSFAKGADQS